MRLFCCVSQKLWMMAVARFTNSVESLSACSLRTATVLRSKISKVANASASTAVDAHLARSRLPKVPLLTQTLNCTTRAWCHGSGLVGVCCRRCVTFSALRHNRRCMHTTVGKLNAVLIWTISQSGPFWLGKEVLGVHPVSSQSWAWFFLSFVIFYSQEAWWIWTTGSQITRRSVSLSFEWNMAHLVLFPSVHTPGFTQNARESNTRWRGAWKWGYCVAKFSNLTSPFVI